MVAAENQLDTQSEPSNDSVSLDGNGRGNCAIDRNARVRPITYVESPLSQTASTAPSTSSPPLLIPSRTSSRLQHSMHMVGQHSQNRRSASPLSSANYSPNAQPFEFDSPSMINLNGIRSTNKLSSSRDGSYTAILNSSYGLNMHGTPTSTAATYTTDTDREMRRTRCVEEIRRCPVPLPARRNRTTSQYLQCNLPQDLKKYDENTSAPSLLVSKARPWQILESEQIRVVQPSQEMEALSAPKLQSRHRRMSPANTSNLNDTTVTQISRLSGLSKYTNRGIHSNPQTPKRLSRTRQRLLLGFSPSRSSIADEGSYSGHKEVKEYRVMNSDENQVHDITQEDDSLYELFDGTGEWSEEALPLIQQMTQSEKRSLFGADIYNWFGTGLSCDYNRSQINTSQILKTAHHQETDVETHRLSFSWIVREFRCFRDHACLAALPHMQNFIESHEFGSPEAGKWYLMLFPSGETSAMKDLNRTPMSGNGSGILVKVVSLNKKSVTARTTLCLLDSAGEEKDEIDDFLSLIPDDTLRLRCDLEVCTSIRDVPNGFRITKEEAEATSLSRQLQDYSTNRICKDITVYLLNTNDHNTDGLLELSKRSFLQTEMNIHHRPIATEYLRQSHSSLSDSDPVQQLESNCIRGTNESIKDKSSSDESTDPTQLLCQIQKDDVSCCRLPGVIASRFVLCARSRVLRAMLHSDFAEGRGESICLSDMSLETLQNMIDYLHTDSCQLLSSNISTKDGLNSDTRVEMNYKETHSHLKDSVQKVIELLKAADKYDCQNLKLSCLQWLVQHVTPETCLEMLKLANQWKLLPLQLACFRLLQDATLCLNGFKQ